MRHLLRNLYGQLHKTCIAAVSIPGCLVDQLFEAVFLDGVNIHLLSLHESFQLCPRRLRMAIQEIRADELFTSRRSKNVNRPIIHLQNNPMRITDCDCTGEFLYPVMIFHQFFSKNKK
jgi:hypothetical protein